MSGHIHKQRGETDGADLVSGAASAGKRSLVSDRYPVQRRAGEPAAADSEQAASGSGSLPAPVREKMEHSFGADFSDVRVHEGGEAASIGAQAFTQGSDIHFAPGRYDPFGHGGQELIGHELAHVVQQSEGRVQATTQAKGAAVNDDLGLEREADEMGARAARGEAAGSRGRTAASGAGVRQLKREPISPAGMSLIGLAKDYFRDLKVPVEKSVSDTQAQGITLAATNLDLTAETNEQFIALANIFKTGLHAHDAEKIRTNVEQKFVALTGEVAAEGAKQVEAEAQELAEGGHALARHGPAVSDDALIKRLHTGIAPDNALVPAPGTSSRFNSHTDVLETRQAAASSLQTAIVGAAGEVLSWLATIPGLATAHTTAQQDVVDKSQELTDADKLKTEGFADKKLSGPEKKARLEAFKLAGTAKKAAETAEVVAGQEQAHPGKNLKRILPGKTPVKFDIKDDIGPGELDDGVMLTESYGIIIEHGRPIGSGHESQDSDAIKLKDVLAVVADNPTTATPTPKSNGEIVSALTGLGVGGNIAEFATYLGDATNLETVKKKADKGAKIYKATSSTGALTKSYTNFKRGGTGALFDDADNLLAVDTSAWEAIQHFPCSNSSTPGVQD